MARVLLAVVLLLGCAGSAIAQNEAAAQSMAYDFTALYDRLNPAIVKIHVDSGSGSGFLVSASGLIATNHHVVRNSRYIAAQFADGRKVRAELVALDPRYDVAILKVNSHLVPGVEPLRILPAARDVEVRAGIPVVAFGSPLSQSFLMTQGIVSKVEESALLGDFLIQPGNSGGPLVNLRGEVIGISTFLEGGISGAVRIGCLRRVLESSDVREYAGPEPSDAALPTASARRYPPEVLKEKILKEPYDREAYVVAAGKFTVTVITPVLVGKAQVQGDLQQAHNRMNRRGKKGLEKREIDGPFYEWMRTATSLMDNVVTFEVKPDFGMTAGSVWAAALSGFAAGLSKSPVQPTHANYEFKAEFQDFKLYRDNELIEPLHPGRAITEASFQFPLATFVDEAYSGMYQYAPEVFLTGSVFRLDVFDAREPGRVHKSIALGARSKIILQIRSDFSGIEGK